MDLGRGAGNIFLPIENPINRCGAMSPPTDVAEGIARRQKPMTIMPMNEDSHLKVLQPELSRSHIRATRVNSTQRASHRDLLVRKHVYSIAHIRSLSQTTTEHFAEKNNYLPIL